MNIGFIGLGKLGLPCALAIESKGHKVSGFDLSPTVANIVKTRKIPYIEAGAQELLDKSQLNFTTIDKIIKESDIIFVPIQTPHEPMYEGITPLPDTRVDFNYTFLKEGIKSISKELDKLGEDRIVVIISTVLPTTIEREIKPLLSKHIKLCYNPFFIAMGTCIQDFLHPEFVLLGVDDQDAAYIVTNFYKTITNALVYKCSIREAEMIKVTYNTFITMKTVFGNNVMELCHKIGADCDTVINALNFANKRITNTSYMYGGMADAGSCHPRDNIALSYYAQKYKQSIDMYEWLMKAREKQTGWLIDIIEENKNNLPVVIMGKSYKPEINIIIGSASILMSNLMNSRGIKHDHYDTIANPGDIALRNKLTNEPHCFFIGTKHEEYKSFPYPKGSIVIDPFRYIPDIIGVKVVRIGQRK